MRDPSPSRRVCILAPLLITFLQQLSTSSGTSWQPARLPSPQNDPTNVCRRSHKRSAVCNPDGLLAGSDANAADIIINSINAGEHGYHQFPCTGHEGSGPQLAIAVVETMAVTDQDTKARRAYFFARKLHKQWGVGDPACQNGIVLVFAIRDHAWGFSIGTGLTTVLSNEHMRGIMQNITPELRNKQYGRAIRSVVNIIGNTLSAAAVDRTSSMSDMWSVLYGHGRFGTVTSMLQFFGIVVCAMIWCCCCVFAVVPNNSDEITAERFARYRELRDEIDEQHAAPTAPLDGRGTCCACLNPLAGSKTSDGAATTEASPMVESAPDASTREDHSSSVKDAEDSTEDGAEDNAEEMGSVCISDRTAELPCGHAFHARCVVAELGALPEIGLVCPVCKTPFRAALDAAAAAAVQDMGGARDGEAANPAEEEISFRMSRLHRIFPEFAPPPPPTPTDVVEGEHENTPLVRVDDRPDYGSSNNGGGANRDSGGSSPNFEGDGGGGGTW